MNDPIIIGDATLYLGDCRDILPTLTSIDAVVTDPPYGVEYEGGHFHSSNVNIVHKRERLKSDDEDVFSWLMPMILNATNGPCYSFYAMERGYWIHKALHEYGAEIHSVLLWHKTNAKYPAMHAQYKRRHEAILYFKRHGGNLEWCGISTESTLLEFPREPENKYHPTQKPTGLIQHLIGNHTSNLICDPMMGSGTTGIAALRLGRKFAGIEIETKYFDIACERIGREHDQLKMFLGGEA